MRKQKPKATRAGMSDFQCLTLASLFFGEKSQSQAAEVDCPRSSLAVSFLINSCRLRGVGPLPTVEEKDFFLQEVFGSSRQFEAC
jgi:hypothetical protein